MTQKTKKTGARLAWHASIFMGTVISIWSIAAFLSGLAQVNWQFTELLRQYLVAVGVMQEFHTMVDFYTYIKGIEYLFCLVFLGFFPAFFTYLNRTKQSVPIGGKESPAINRS
jgi:hypothetical protein